jgi:hypothetical protein
MDDAVDPGDLLAGVGDDEVAARSVRREDVLPLDVAGVDDDLTAADQFVEGLSGILAAAYPQ